MLQEQLLLSGGPRSFFCHDISAPSCECVDHGLRVFLRYHPTSFASRSEECVDAREKVACWMEITLPKTQESKLLQNTVRFRQTHSSNWISFETGATSVLVQMRVALRSSYLPRRTVRMCRPSHASSRSFSGTNHIGHSILRRCIILLTPMSPVLHSLHSTF